MPPEDDIFLCAPLFPYFQRQNKGYKSATAAIGATKGALFLLNPACEIAAVFFGIVNVIIARPKKSVTLLLIDLRYNVILRS